MLAPVSGDPDRGGGPADGMFRGLSSWLGLQQPASGGGQHNADAPPEQPSETVAESAEEELQQTGDQELLHQAKDFGSESPLALGPGWWGARSSSGTTLGRGPDWLWDEGAEVRGRGGRCVCRSVLSGSGEIGEDLDKATASSSSQVLSLKFLVASLQSLQTLESGMQPSSVTQRLRV